MANGTDLLTLRQMLKGQCSISLSVGTAIDAELNSMLATYQKWLSAEWDWPQLRNYQDVNIGAGTRYIAVPNLNFQRPLETVQVKWSNVWQGMDYGIGVEEYNYIDSDQRTTQDPMQRWDVVGQFEIAIPTTAATAAVSGNGLTGTYKYAVTYVTPYGETPIGPSVTIVLANQGVNLTAIPVAANQSVEGTPFTEVTARNIYRTKAGGTSFFLIGTVAGNITTIYGPDNKADALLLVAAPTSNTAEATVAEVWPMPASAQVVRFYGQRVLSPLVADTDTADLDDILIVFFAAAAYKANKKQADAGLKLSEANERLARVKQTGLKRKRRVFMGRSGGGQPKPRLTSVQIGVH